MNTPFSRLFVIGVVSALLIFSSCKEVLTNTELLTQHTWEFSSVEHSDPDPDLKEFYTILLTGITTKFNSDGTYFIDAPDSSLADDSSGPWEFGADETTIIIDKGTADESTSTILDLTESTFSYSITDSLGTATVKWLPKE
ncbi:MAG: hypothetical protein AAF587_23690 [Bacteroidota bacterium]